MFSNRLPNVKDLVLSFKKYVILCPPRCLLLGRDCRYNLPFFIYIEHSYNNNINNSCYYFFVIFVNIYFCMVCILRSEICDKVTRFCDWDKTKLILIHSLEGNYIIV